MTSDDLIGTVKAALDELAASDKSDGKYSGAELRRKAKALAGVQEPAEDWLRALLARCEAAEDENAELREGRIPAGWLAMHANDKRLYDAARAEVERKDAILRQLVKDGRLWIDLKDLQAARVRVVYQPEHESEVVKARAEAARLREALGRLARNTCCDCWQEAALVARAALDTPAREGGRGDDSDCV